MKDSTINALGNTLYRLLRPLVTILVRNGFAYSAFTDICKKVYVDVAKEEFPLPGRKQTASRISLLTGLPRKDVAVVLSQPDALELDEWEATNRTARVVMGWINDPAFKDASGSPLTLAIEPNDDGVSFHDLVKKYSGDVPVKATLNELVNIGSVVKEGDTHVRLKTKSYLPETGDEQKLWLLGTAGADLYRTINHNLVDPENGFIQRYTYYDDIPEEVLELIRDKARKQSIEFLQQVEAWLSAYDRDANPTVHGTGRYRAGIGVYYFENPMDDRKENEA